MRALNQAEKALFELIYPQAQGNLALVSTEFNGIETGCITLLA